MVLSLTSLLLAIRYLEHMLRRLNALGRDNVVLRELETLPKDTNDVYRALLKDCQKSRSAQDLEVLRTLFAWLAYSKSPVTLAVASTLLCSIAKDHSISIDEEIEHRCARILRLSNADTDDQQSDASDNETDHEDDEARKTDDEVDSHEDGNVLLGFQDRSLRRYFCQEGVGEDPLRTGRSRGNFLIFKVIENLLTTGVEDDQLSSRLSHLHSYACQKWFLHLQDINTSQLTDPEVASMIESLCNILSNRNNSLSILETYIPCRRSSWEVLGSTTDERESALATLQTLAKKAMALPSTTLSAGTLAWIRPLASKPETVYIKAAEGHVTNWLTMPPTRDPWLVWRSFRFAHNALRLGKDLPSIQGNKELKGCFEKSGDRNEVTEQSILIVSRAFLHIEKTTVSDVAIGVAMTYEDMDESGLEQLRVALSSCDINRERLQVFEKIAGCLFDLADKKKTETEELTDIGSSINSASNAGGSAGVIEKEVPETGTSGTEKQAGYQTETGNNSQSQKPAIEKTYLQWIQEANDVLKEATELDVSLSEDPKGDQDLRWSLTQMFLHRARAELILGSSDNTIEYISKATRVNTSKRPISCYELITMLGEKNEVTKAVEVLRILEKRERGFCLLGMSDNMHKILKEADQVEYGNEIYLEGTNAVWIGKLIAIELATFYRTGKKLSAMYCHSRCIPGTAIAYLGWQFLGGCRSPPKK
jgi:hypothetical protein